MIWRRNPTWVLYTDLSITSKSAQDYNPNRKTVTCTPWVCQGWGDANSGITFKIINKTWVVEVRKIMMLTDVDNI